MKIRNFNSKQNKGLAIVPLFLYKNKRQLLAFYHKPFSYSPFVTSSLIDSTTAGLSSL